MIQVGANLKRISLILLFSVCLCFANSFEESLLAEPSEIDLVYRLREQMLSALQAKDTTGILALTEMLAEKKTDGILPISLLEIEVVYLKAKMYNSLTEYLVKYYRNLPDTLEKISEVPSPDGLSAFVAKQIGKKDTSRSVFYVFENMVKNSRLSDAEKKKLELFVCLANTYKISEMTVHVAWLARTYVKENPDDPDTPWIEKCISAPLERKYSYNYFLEKRAANKEALIRYKLYTSGFGLNVFLLSGGIVNSFEDYYNEKKFEAYEFEIKMELYLQLGRFVPMFDIVNLGVPGFTTFAFGMGMVVYDSRYLKVRPYVEYGITGMYVGVKDIYHQSNETPTNGQDVYDTGSFFSDFDGNALIAGVNVDLKVITAYMFHSIEKLFSFSLVGKAGFAYVDINNAYAWGEGVTLFFGLGLGVYFW